MVSGSNLGVGQGFLHQSRPALGPIQPPVQWVFLGGKAAGVWLDHPPHIAPRLKTEYSYTSASLRLSGLFYGERYF
jgi:hypothetical protein